MQSLQVDSVQRWMEDLRHMTEVECMCVLQAKPIGVEEDAQQGELIVASGVGAGDHVARNNLQTLLRRALVVSTELGKMFQRLEKGRWQRVHSTAVRANCHVRSLVHEYSAARSTPPEMQKVTDALKAVVRTPNWLHMPSTSKINKALMRDLPTHQLKYNEDFHMLLQLKSKFRMRSVYM